MTKNSKFLSVLTDLEILRLAKDVVFSEESHPAVRAVSLIIEKNERKAKKYRQLTDHDLEILLTAFSHMETTTFNGVGKEADYLGFLSTLEHNDEVRKAERLLLIQKVRADMGKEVA